MRHIPFDDLLPSRNPSPTDDGVDREPGSGGLDDVAGTVAVACGSAARAQRACQISGVAHLDDANFADACRCLERSLLLARASGDPELERIACSAIARLFSEMGCHVDAMAMADRCLAFPGDTLRIGRLRIVDATTGLGSAHSLDDEEAALRYLSVGTAALDDPRVDAVARSNFEYRRALFLLAHDDAETAETLIDAALARHATTSDARVRTLLETAAALCHSASLVPSRQALARRQLAALRLHSGQTRIHHDEVLRALMQVHDDPASPDGPRCGEAFAKELVEYTASVLRARLHRQMSDRGGSQEVAENWAMAAGLLDDEAGEHGFRVGRLAGLLAAELGMDVEACARIERAARLHDIGRIAVDEVILRQRGPLTSVQRAALQAHAEAGGTLLRRAEDPTSTMAAAIARHHHERWNGTGYPQGLAADDIPLPARICALADAYDTLTHPGRCKRAWPHRTAVEQLMSEAGVSFDPRLMMPFLRVLERQAGSRSGPASTAPHLEVKNANGLLVSCRSLRATADRSRGGSRSVRAARVDRFRARPR